MLLFSSLLLLLRLSLLYNTKIRQLSTSHSKSRDLHQAPPWRAEENYVYNGWSTFNEEAAVGRKVSMGMGAGIGIGIGDDLFFV